jgi:hypothetical protein
VTITAQLEVTRNETTERHWDARVNGTLVAVIANPGPRYWWVHWVTAAPNHLAGTRGPRQRSKIRAEDYIVTSLWPPAEQTEAVVVSSPMPDDIDELAEWLATDG